MRTSGSATKSYITFQLEGQQPHLGPPHPLLRSSVSAQAGTFSPCPKQVMALQPGLCLLTTSHVSSHSFPPGLHQLLSPATPDQATGWTLGLADTFTLSGPGGQRGAEILSDCAGVPACPAVQGSPALAAPWQTPHLKNL